MYRGVGKGLTCFVSPCLPALQHQHEAPGQLSQIGLKLEQYLLNHTGEWASPWSARCQGPQPPGSAACALSSQRSESEIKMQTHSTLGFRGSRGCVTSKRHLFEKELVGQSREGPATSRKVSGSGPGFLKATEPGVQAGAWALWDSSAAPVSILWTQGPDHTCC